MHTTSATLPININGSKIGAYMTAETSRALLARSKALRRHVLLVRAVEAERGTLTVRGPDRRLFETNADLLAFADRRQSQRRFAR